MGLFDRRPKGPTAEQMARAAAEAAQRSKHKLAIMDKLIERIDSQMRSNRSFSDELYPTGIKQGKYAGLMTSTNAIARRLSRVAHNESPVAQAFVSTLATLCIGHGLELEAQPKWGLLPPAAPDTPATQSEWMRETESRYELWSRRRSVSYEKDMSRPEQEQESFRRLLIDGEYFEIYRYASTANRNPLSIQIIRSEDVRSASGSKVSNGNTECDGIEYDAKGEAVAYHIYNHTTTQTVRVTKTGARSGRVFVNHVKLGGNRRGIGILADMITELVKLGDYEVLELQAAVVNALYALWVETPDGSDGVPTINGQGGIAAQGSEPEQSSTDAEKWLQDRKEKDYATGGLTIDAMPGGYKIQSHDTKRPNVNFGNFMDQVKKNLAASKGLPVSVIDKQFQNNYSASRGELILAWYEIERYRFNQSMTSVIVYKMWMWGEVAAGRIIAAGFLVSENARDAWTASKWIGPQRPDIDPLRSVKAHEIEQDRGFKTGKQITAERGGGDYDENLIRVKIEKEKLREMEPEPAPVGGLENV